MTTQVISLAEYLKRQATNRMGLWLFILSDAFVFDGLVSVAFLPAGCRKSPGCQSYLGVAVTSVLLLSSFFMNRAETAMAFGDRKKF